MHVCVSMYVLIFVCVSVCVHFSVFVTCVFMSLSVSVYLYMCMCLCVFVSVCLYVQYCTCIKSEDSLQNPVLSMWVQGFKLGSLASRLLHKWGYLAKFVFKRHLLIIPLHCQYFLKTAISSQTTSILKSLSAYFSLVLSSYASGAGCKTVMCA